MPTKEKGYPAKVAAGNFEEGPVDAIRMNMKMFVNFRDVKEKTWSRERISIREVSKDSMQTV